MKMLSKNTGNVSKVAHWLQQPLLLLQMLPEKVRPDPFRLPAIPIQAKRPVRRHQLNEYYQYLI
jgi:hypothetical protein